MTNNCNDSLNNIVDGLFRTTLVEKPCKVIKVNSQYSVDIEYYDKNKRDVLYSVPVKHLQTSSAYVFLGLAIGDCGTVRFFDSDVSAYMHNTRQSVDMTRKHDINDSVFSCGFYPAREQYLFPTGDVVIGTTSGAVINLSQNTVTISGADINITAGNVVLGTNTTIDGKVFLEHTHENGHEGLPTGGVL